MLQTNEAYLDLAFRKIRKEYGSVEKYLLKELNLTEKEIAELKEVLLL
ncbi:MAG: tyrosine-protein phosphatase [Tannerellaceae bacterium]|nr:tyrosine-protein phosphatase [Tannerellaceae bacterium]